MIQLRSTSSSKTKTLHIIDTITNCAWFTLMLSLVSADFQVRWSRVGSNAANAPSSTLRALSPIELLRFEQKKREDVYIVSSLSLLSATDGPIGKRIFTFTLSFLTYWWLEGEVNKRERLPLKPPRVRLSSHSPSVSILTLKRSLVYLFQRYIAYGLGSEFVAAHLQIMKFSNSLESNTIAVLLLLYSGYYQRVRPTRSIFLGCILRPPDRTSRFYLRNSPFQISNSPILVTEWLELDLTCQLALQLSCSMSSKFHWVASIPLQFYMAMLRRLKG